MVLIVITSTLFFVSAGNIRKSFRNDLRAYASCTVESMINEADSVVCGEQTISHGEFKTLTQVTRNYENTDIYYIKITAYSNDGQVLISRDKIHFYKPATAEKEDK